MNILCFDLEMNQPSNKIISLGACVGSLEKGAILASMHRYVQIDEVITPFIENLTGVTNDLVKTYGVPLEQAFADMIEMKTTNECLFHPYTWGGGDVSTLREQLGDKAPWPMGRRYVDVKTLWVSWALANGQNPSGGLAKICNRLGHPFQGQKHNAESDAINTFKVMHSMHNKFKEKK